MGRVLVCGATAGFDPKEDLRYIWSFEIEVKGSNSFYDDDLRGLFPALRGDFVERDLPAPSLALPGGEIPTRKVAVYLPPRFVDGGDETFPVVYFLGGYGQKPKDFAPLRELLDVLTATGDVQNMKIGRAHV